MTDPSRIVRVAAVQAAAVIAPNGRYLAGPGYDEETVVVADCDLAEITREAMTLDVSGGGHYSRPDVFEFRVKTAGEGDEGRGKGRLLR